MSNISRKLLLTLSPSSSEIFGGAHIVKKVQQITRGIDIPIIVTTVMMRKFVSIIRKIFS